MSAEPSKRSLEEVEGQHTDEPTAKRANTADRPPTIVELCEKAYPVDQCYDDFGPLKSFEMALKFAEIIVGTILSTEGVAEIFKHLIEVPDSSTSTEHTLCLIYADVRKSMRYTPKSLESIAKECVGGSCPCDELDAHYDEFLAELGVVDDNLTEHTRVKHGTKHYTVLDAEDYVLKGVAHAVGTVFMNLFIDETNPTAGPNGPILIDLEEVARTLSHELDKRVPKQFASVGEDIVGCVGVLTPIAKALILKGMEYIQNYQYPAHYERYNHDEDYDDGYPRSDDEC